MESAMVCLFVVVELFIFDGPVKSPIFALFLL